MNSSDPLSVPPQAATAASNNGGNLAAAAELSPSSPTTLLARIFTPLRAKVSPLPSLLPVNNTTTTTSNNESSNTTTAGGAPHVSFSPTAATTATKGLTPRAAASHELDGVDASSMTRASSAAFTSPVSSASWFASPTAMSGLRHGRLQRYATFPSQLGASKDMAMADMVEGDAQSPLSREERSGGHANNNTNNSSSESRSTAMMMPPTQSPGMEAKVANTRRVRTMQSCAPHMVGYRDCLEANLDIKSNCSWALDEYIKCQQKISMDLEN